MHARGLPAPARSHARGRLCRCPAAMIPAVNLTSASQLGADYIGAQSSFTVVSQAIMALQVYKQAERGYR